MKVKIVLILTTILFLLYSQTYSQNKIFELIGTDIKSFIDKNGSPAQITQTKNRDLYIYETELGYQSFLVSNKIIKSINNTTYWDTKKKAKEALELEKKFYESDGFQIEKKDNSTYNFSNRDLTVVLSLEKEKNFYSLSETIYETIIK